MSEETIGIKTVLTIISTVAGLVTAYWLARRSASKENLDLERQLNKLRLQVTQLSGSAQDRDDVKVLVRESLDNLSTILNAIKDTSDTNSDDLKAVLIQQGVLNEKVQALEERNRAERNS
jgi:hypothetical protein